MVETDYVLPPPSNKVETLKNPIGLLFQVIVLGIAFWISLLRTIYHKFVPIKNKNISGQVVLITGSGRGLGRELALQFARKGCKVACAEIQNELNEETVQLVNALSPDSCKGYYCDVGSIESIQTLKKQVLADFGRVDILVNNAGLIFGGALLNDFDPKIFEKVTRINFLSHLYTCRTFLPEMVERNSGHVVCIASMSALIGLRNASLYSACKWAITGFMESVREELRANPANKVEITVACPYFINTSAHYMENWDCRFPNLRPEQAAEEIIKGVLQNQFIFSIPEEQYLGAVFSKLVPQDIKDKFVDIFHARVKDQQTKEIEHMPIYKMINKETGST